MIATLKKSAVEAVGVALFVTLDTEEETAAVVLDELISGGVSPIVIDVLVLGEPRRGYPGVAHGAVATAAGRPSFELVASQFWPSTRRWYGPSGWKETRVSAASGLPASFHNDGGASVLCSMNSSTS